MQGVGERGSPSQGFIGLHIFPPGDLRLTGDLCLAESTAIPIETILGCHIILGNREKVPTTGGLILTRLCDGLHRASLYAYAANALREKEAVLMMVRIGPVRRRHLDSGNDRSRAHRFTNRGDQAIAKPEG